MTLANNQYFENHILVLLLRPFKNTVKCAETSHILRHNQHLMKNARHITVATNRLQQLPNDNNPTCFTRSLSDEKLNGRGGIYQSR